MFLTNDVCSHLQEGTETPNGPCQVSEAFLSLENVMASRREDAAPSPGKLFLQCWAGDVTKLFPIAQTKKKEREKSRVQDKKKSWKPLNQHTPEWTNAF